MRRSFLNQPSCSWGTWCSGITSAPHAEGPGLKSQCVHWRVRSAAAAAVGVQGTLLHPCFVLSYYAQCLCRLFWGALCPPSQDWPGAAAHLATEDATINMEQGMPRSSTPQCMCCAADDRSIAAPGKLLLMGLTAVRAHASYVYCPG